MCFNERLQRNFEKYIAKPIKIVKFHLIQLDVASIDLILTELNKSTRSSLLRN